MAFFKLMGILISKNNKMALPTVSALMPPPPHFWARSASALVAWLLSPRGALHSLGPQLQACWPPLHASGSAWAQLLPPLPHPSWPLRPKGRCIALQAALEPASWVRGGRANSQSAQMANALLTSYARQLNRGPTAQTYLLPDSWPRAQGGPGSPCLCSQPHCDISSDRRGEGERT